MISSSERIGADKSNPVLLIFLIADADDLCRDLLFFPNRDIDREQIFATAAAFLTNAEYLLDGECFSFVFIVDAGTLFDHGNGIQAKILDGKELCGTGEPCVKQNVVGLMPGRLCFL